MNWMFESRSKDYYDDEVGTYSPVKWYEVILAILLLPLFMVLIDLLVILAFYGFYSIAKKTYYNGEAEFPRLTIIGICLAAILYIAHLRLGFEFADHPHITFWSLIFIIYCTLAPLTGLVWWLFKQKPKFLKQ